MDSSTDAKRNLIIVSNRLPISVKCVDGAIQSSLSSGGLVTALSGLTKSTQFRWFGWPGIEAKEPEEQEKVANSLDQHNASPIFLDSHLAHEHYNGFSSMSISCLIFDTMFQLTDCCRPHPLADPPLPIRRHI